MVPSPLSMNFMDLLPRKLSDTPSDVEGLCVRWPECQTTLPVGTSLVTTSLKPQLPNNNKWLEQDEHRNCHDIKGGSWRDPHRKDWFPYSPSMLRVRKQRDGSRGSHFSLGQLSVGSLWSEEINSSLCGAKKWSHKPQRRMCMAEGSQTPSRG